ncbi:uos5 s1 protein [Cystoisospora suis]|uniref:Uos5 s1 protein n=1 Tax=Cystoisospora suis TaxID=483139 RepID=A0A2C6KJY5_9APIC|nr:uos5 s1 protein [Cystoisospora suis]
MSATAEPGNFLPPSRKLLQLAASRGAGRPIHATDLSTTKFYKTKLCPFMRQRRSGGRCSEGLDCGYAHAVEELRVAPNLQRTKWCSKVVNGQACTDPKCGYAHFAAELQPSTDKQTLKTSLCIFWSRNPKLCMNGDKCRFAHGEGDLRKRPDLSPRRPSPLISSVLPAPQNPDSFRFAVPRRLAVPCHESPEPAPAVTTVEADPLTSQHDRRSGSSSPDKTFREDWDALPQSVDQSASDYSEASQQLVSLSPTKSENCGGAAASGPNKALKQSASPSAEDAGNGTCLPLEGKRRHNPPHNTDSLEHATTDTADGHGATPCDTSTSGGPPDDFSGSAFPILLSRSLDNEMRVAGADQTSCSGLLAAAYLPSANVSPRHQSSKPASLQHIASGCPRSTGSGGGKPAKALDRAALLGRTRRRTEEAATVSTTGTLPQAQNHALRCWVM